MENGPDAPDTAAAPGAADEPPHLPELPPEIWGEIGRCLSMKDLAALARADKELHDRFWGGVTVHTQDELDEALQRHGLWFIVIEGGGLTMSAPQVEETPVIAVTDVLVTAGEVHARDGIHITATGSAQVGADGQAQVTAYDQVHVFAFGQSVVTAYDQAHVSAHEQAYVTAHGHASVSAYTQTQVAAHEHATVNAFGQAHVTAYDQAEVHAYRQTRVTAHDEAIVHAYNQARVARSGAAPGPGCWVM
ncbi:hypothetical protein AB0N09_43225 [Streptomyces erythrochromogenes]|uniref:hypothetical protein n=1 Tax=Streptomyces erythrochromogenes TaxID=285574 RepID=UPI003448D75D